MAAYDFPDTTGRPTDGSFVYTAPTGEVYSWNGYAWVSASGTNISGYVKKAGDTMSGALSVPANAISTQVPQVQEVVQKTGDTMTGALNVPAGATATQVPQIQEVVQKTGDTMTGDLTVPNITVPGTGVIDAMQTPKAMVNFGVDGSGVITINTSYNIASVTPLAGLGTLRITFTNPLPGTAVVSHSSTKALFTGGATFIYTDTGGPPYWDIGTIGSTAAGTLEPATAEFYFLVWYAA